ncbi:MAG TPA: hypothetical protein VLC53_09065, partial [Myxococcota bacterium]|nr:hypothetical protein [Myxococcota bacterium]
MTLSTPVTQTTFDPNSARRGEPESEVLAPLEALIAEARDPRAPVLQRLRGIGALGRRVDALFQVRAAELRVRESGPRGAATRARVRALVREGYAFLTNEVLPAANVTLPGWRELAGAERRALSRRFAGEVSPLLTPLTVDAAHPFPCVASLALCVAILVRGPRGAGERYVGIEVPPAVPRFLNAARGGPLVAIEDVIGSHLSSLLGGCEIVCHHAFRATRDSRPLRARLGASGGPRTRAAVRMEVEAATPPDLRRLLVEGLGLDPESDVDESPGPLDLAAVAALPLSLG